MLARVEKPDGAYETLDMGDYVCGEDYCDSCGDCLACYGDDPCGDNKGAGHSWVIYIDNPKNPYFTDERSRL